MELDYNRSLGVCIPTYKRPDQLRRCVQSVIAAAAPFRVPIFISDNSADQTNAKVIAELRLHYEYIFYEHNEVNLGIDRNILKSVDLCKADYAWLLGEDDRMLPDAIDTVLQIIQRPAGPPDFVCVNYSYVDHEVAQILREKILPLKQDAEIPVQVFLRSWVWAIGFIGSCVISKKRWSAMQPQRYVGTYFAHVGAILESIAGRSVVMAARPLVWNRIGNADVVTWSHETYNVFEGWEQMTKLLEPIYGADLCLRAAAAFRAGTGYGSLRFLCSRRADRIYDRTVYRKLIHPDESKGVGYKLLAMLIASAPCWIFHVARVTRIRMARRKNRKITEIDLTQERGASGDRQDDRQDGRSRSF